MLTHKQNEDYDFLMKYLYLQTGFPCAIAMGYLRNGKSGWQVMVDCHDCEIYIFWNWYCDNFEDEQFYENIYECVVKFLDNYDKWKSLGKPKPSYL